MIKMERVLVTPETATKWLILNHIDQRQLRERAVARFAADMKTGDWKETHQGIAFNKAGRLIDGQHRLAAIVKAGVPIWLWVATDVDAEYNAPIDQGVGRKPKDILKWQHQKIAVVSALHNMQTIGMQNGAPSLAQMRETYELNRDDVDAVLGLLRPRLVTSYVIAALAYLRPLDPTAVDEFGAQVADGEMLQRGMPAFALRNWMQTKPSGGSGRSFESCYATFSAGLHHLDREPYEKVYASVRAYYLVSQRRRARQIPRSPRRES